MDRLRSEDEPNSRQVFKSSTLWIVFGLYMSVDCLLGCTSPHKIERDGTIKYEMIRLLNLKKFGVPIVSRLLVVRTILLIYFCVEPTRLSPISCNEFESFSSLGHSLL